MRAFVTGADGLLGSNVVRELLARGDKVRVLVEVARSSPTLDGLDVERIEGDLLEKGDWLAAAVEGCDCVFHCAAIADIFADRQALWDVNVGGTERVIDACLRARPGRLVFVGSASSFEFGPLDAPGDERGGFPAAYRGIPYFESKHAAKSKVEAAVRDEDLDAVVVCPTFMLGRYDYKPSSGDLIRRFAQGQIRFVSPGGRNFTRAADVAQAMVNSASRAGPGAAYILGGENLTYADFFAQVAEAIGRRPPRVLPSASIRAVGAGGSALAKLTRKRAPIDDTTARLACLDTYYSSAKAVAELDMPQTPVGAAIEDAVASLIEYGHIEAPL